MPADHLVWFLLETLQQLDLRVFHARHPNDGAGRAAYDPEMMVALLIYAYCCGERSSRQIERLCQVNVAFRVVCAGDIPDHTKIARFRAVHQDAFEAVFAQVLAVAAKAGLARFETRRDRWDEDRRERVPGRQPGREVVAGAGRDDRHRGGAGRCR